MKFFHYATHKSRNFYDTHEIGTNYTGSKKMYNVSMHQTKCAPSLVHSMHAHIAGN